MEGLSGKARAGLCAGGIDAEVSGGLSDTCCTSTIVPMMIASPVNDITPPRQYLRGIRRVSRCSAVPFNSTRHTCTGRAIFLTVCSPLSW